MYRLKKYVLIISVVFLIGICFVIFNPISAEAVTGGDNFINHISTGANHIISTGQNGLNTRGINIDVSMIGDIAQVIWTAGCIIIIALTIYKAVKYGLSGPSEKASAKKELIGWILIALIIIAAYPLAKLIISAFDGSLWTSNIVNQLNGVSQGLSAASANSTFMLILNTFLRVIQVGASGYIIIKFIVVGIKYMTTPSSYIKAEQKGELVNTLIQAVVIFGAVGFFEILYRAFN